MRNLGIVKKLDELSANRTVKVSLYALAIALFIALILLPPILGIIVKWNTVNVFLAQPTLVGQALGAVRNSFAIALLVAALDLAAGIPLAWLIARRKSRAINIIDTLADIPFIVPTAVLGGSLLLFWSTPEEVSQMFQWSLVSEGWLLVLLLHFTFSLPVVVRVIVGALLDYKREYENASRTLGAPPFTASRTVTFPILKPSLIAAFILSFSRSVSETGATFVVAGTFLNGSIFIQQMQNLYQKTDPNLYNGATVYASLILIAVSVIIFILIQTIGPRLRLPVNTIYPRFERKISYKKAEVTRDISTLLVFFIIALIPSLFIALPAIQAIGTPTLGQALSGTGVWAEYWQGITLSYGLATIVTVLNVIIGLPVAIAVARRKL